MKERERERCGLDEYSSANLLVAAAAFASLA